MRGERFSLLAATISGVFGAVLLAARWADRLRHPLPS